MLNPDPFEKYTGEYEAWFDKNHWAYESELEAVRSQLPERGKGIEIGVGSGRFAGPLGIKTGVDPSSTMRELAEKRGIKTFDAKAEKLPFNDASFDYALMVVTICFLNDAVAALRETYRILKTDGVLVVGFVDKDSFLGKQYQEKKSRSKFYQSARFYSVKEVIHMTQEAGFSQLNIVQTLFGDIQKMDAADFFKEGYGQGAFVVLKVRKRGG